MKKLIKILPLLLLLISTGANGAIVTTVSDATDYDVTTINAVGTEKQSTGGSPVGSVVAWPFADIPDDWLECNGQAVDATLYPELRARISHTPNYQGMFLRGYGTQSHIKNNGSTVGNTSTNHASAGLRSLQGDSVRNVSGSYQNGYMGDNVFGGSYKATGVFYSTSIDGRGGYNTGHNQNNGSPDGYGFSFSRSIPISNEIRPVNKAVKYIIKAR